MRHDRFLKLAKSVSQKSTDRVKIGAVLVSGGHAISVGFNKMSKTHPRMARLSHFRKMHAELDAIIGIYKNDLSGSTVYVYREQLDGQVGMCKPCDSCQIIMKEAGVKRVYYTDPTLPNNLGYLDLR